MSTTKKSKSTKPSKTAKPRVKSSKQEEKARQEQRRESARLCREAEARSAFLPSPHHGSLQPSVPLADRTASLAALPASLVRRASAPPPQRLARAALLGCLSRETLTARPRLARPGVPLPLRSFQSL